MTDPLSGSSGQIKPERPDRRHVLEPHPQARHQRPALPGTVSSPEIQREPGIRGTRSRDSSTRQPPARHRTDQERANPTDKISRRAASILGKKVGSRNHDTSAPLPRAHPGKDTCPVPTKAARSVAADVGFVI